MLSNSKDWTSDHADLPSFFAILSTIPGETLSAMGHTICTAFSSITSDHERDPELRMALLRSVDAILEDSGQSCAFCNEHGHLLVQTVILPPLVWRAGMRYHV